MNEKIKKIQAIIAETDKNFNPYYDVIPELIKKHNYRKGIEIGVFAGGHALKLLDAGIDLLIGIDPYKMFEPGMPGLTDQQDWDILRELVSERLVGYGYLHMHLNSNDAHGFFVHASDLYDFVFIDGLHTAKQLKKDLGNYGALIKKGGIVACHDYNHPSFFELTKVIDDYVKEHNKELIIGPLHLVYWYQ